MAIGPAGDRVYVANTDVNSVTVIDTVVATIPTGAHTDDVAITPDGTRGHVANDSAITVLDTRTTSVTATVAVPGGGILEHVTIAPDGRRADLTVQRGLVVIDTTTNTLVGTIALPTDETPATSRSPPTGAAPTSARPRPTQCWWSICPGCGAGPTLLPPPSCSASATGARRPGSARTSPSRRTSGPLASPCWR